MPKSSITTKERESNWWWPESPILAVAEIRRNSDGLTRLYPTDFYGAFIWDEGNYSCDCNRAIFFTAETDEDDDMECGDTAFSVRITALDDRRLLYQDGEDWTSSPVFSVEDREQWADNLKLKAEAAEHAERLRKLR